MEKHMIKVMDAIAAAHAQAENVINTRAKGKDTLPMWLRDDGSREFEQALRDIARLEATWQMFTDTSVTAMNDHKKGMKK